MCIRDRLLGGLGRRRPDTRDDRHVVRLARDADQVADGRGRREENGVEAAALDRLTRVRRRRRRAHGPVGGDVVDLPPELDQPGDQRLRGDVGARQEDAVDRVEDRVVRRPVLQESGRGLLAARHQVRLHTELHQRGRGLLADRGDLDAREGARVEPVLLELLADGLDGVDRGEGDPLVAARHQALDRALHLLRGARRLHGDRRHLVRHRAVGTQLVGERSGLFLRPRYEDPPAEQRLRLEPGQVLAARGGAVLADHAYDGAGTLGRGQHLALLEDLGDRAQGRRPGPLARRGAGDRHGQRGVGLAPGAHQLGCGGRGRLQRRGDDEDPVARPGLAPAARRRGPRVDEPHVRALLVAQRDTGVRGHADGGRDTGHHLEGDPLVGAREHLVGGVAVESGVTGDGTHDPPAGACGLHDKIGRVPDHRDPGGC